MVSLTRICESSIVKEMIDFLYYKNMWTVVNRDGHGFRILLDPSRICLFLRVWVIFLTPTGYESDLDPKNN